MTTFYSDVKPLPKYSPVTLHLSPAINILNENPARTHGIYHLTIFNQFTHLQLLLIVYQHQGLEQDHWASDFHCFEYLFLLLQSKQGLFRS